MPAPVGMDGRVDLLLTNMSIGYRNGLYIADSIFPICPVEQQSAIVPKFDQSHWFRDAAHLRAPGTRSRGGGFTVDKTDTYFCHRYSFRDEISDEDRANTAAPFNLDVNAVELVSDKTQMRREVAFATDFFTTGVWGSDVTGGVDFTKWSDYGLSTPLVDVTTYKDTVEGRIGREPNTFVVGKQVWSKLRWHPDLLDTIKYTQRGQVTQELVASLMEIERFLVGKAIYTTSPEGTAESAVAYSRIWGKSGLLVYVPAAPSLMTPAAGYTFVWQRVPAALQWIKRMRNEEREVDIIESNTYFDQKATASRAGLFLSTVID